MPYEVQNCFVATQMPRYGQVIPESVRRGYSPFDQPKTGLKN